MRGRGEENVEVGVEKDGSVKGEVVEELVNMGVWNRVGGVGDGRVRVGVRVKVGEEVGVWGYVNEVVEEERV